jgi:CRP-like cAMP-binding protein
LKDTIDERPSLHRLLLRYAQALNVQTSVTAFANANHTLEMRLARWLLMCHDRLDGDDIEITHEFMAMMLGVRRAGVTTSLHILEGNRLIRSTRGLSRCATGTGSRSWRTMLMGCRRRSMPA